MGKQLVNFITCGCESSAPFCDLQSWARTRVAYVKLHDLRTIVTHFTWYQSRLAIERFNFVQLKFFLCVSLYLFFTTVVLPIQMMIFGGELTN
jgi:hypothetical protein